MSEPPVFELNMLPLIEPLRIVDKELSADVEAQDKNTAKEEANAEAGTAQKIIQTLIPGIADVHKSGAANGAESQSAKGEIDHELIDKREANFIADQGQFGSP